MTEKQKRASAQRQIDLAMREGAPATTQTVIVDGIEYVPYHYITEEGGPHWHGELPLRARRVRVTHLHNEARMPAVIA